MRACGNWLKTYAEYTAGSESPAQLHFWTGVSVLAAVLRRRVWIDQVYFQWTPNFYIIFVGPPGVVAKSTTVRIGHSLLESVNGVHFGPNSMTWQGLTETLSRAAEMVPCNKEDYLTMSCITCSVSELGTFLRPEDKRMLDVLTDLWDGQQVVWRHTTRTQEEIKIVNPWINVVACTTPAWLRDNLSTTAVEGGLLRRVVFVFADTKRFFVPYPAEVIVKAEHDGLQQKLIEDLIQIGSLIGEYKLAPDAVLWGNEWYKNLWSKRPKHLESDRFSGYIASKQTHIHKLAMVLAAAARDELVITKNDLELANSFVTGLEGDMRHVMEAIGVIPASRHTIILMDILRKRGGQAPQIDIWRICMQEMSLREFGEATEASIKAGYLKLRQEGTKIIYVAAEKEKEVEIEADIPI